jgi:hypothetical protein
LFFSSAFKSFCAILIQILGQTKGENMKRSIWQIVSTTALIITIMVAGVSAIQDGTRIKFRRGATSATVRGTVADGGPDFYLVGGYGGQAIEVRVTGKVTFGIDSPEGNLTEDDGNTTFEGVLPADGDNTIKVYSRGGTQNYSLTVSIHGN